MATIVSHKDLRVYQAAIALSLEILSLTKKFPKEEKFSMTDQMRRSSRSVCANIAEAWRKRRYVKSFVSKLSDAETEAAETQVWLELAVHHGYLTLDRARELDARYEKLLSQIVTMIDHPEKWLLEPPKLAS